MRNFINKIIALFDFVESKDWNFLGLLLGGLLLIGQFSTFVGVLWDSAISRPILMAYDDDSSYGVETSEKTFLLNHNGSTTYGPIYYRLTWPLKQLFADPNVYSELDNNKNESRDRNVFFAMMIINLLAAYGSAYLIMRMLTKNRGWKILGTIVLVSAFLHNEMRSLLLFLAKPDWLVTFFVTWGVTILVDYVGSQGEQGGQNSVQNKDDQVSNQNKNEQPFNQKVENRVFKKLACSWSIAMATKLICIYFLPGFLFVFYDKIKTKLSFIKYYKFLLLIAAFYFVIGFPQNLDLLGYLKYLLQQNKQTSLVDWKFLSEQWIPLFSKDLILPMLVVFVFAIIANAGSHATTQIVNRVTKNQFLRLFGFVMLPIGLVLIKQTSAPFQWYTFPFVNAFLVFFAVLANAIIQQSLKTFRTQVASTHWMKLQPYKLFAIHLCTPFVFNLFPVQVYQTYKSRIACRQEIFNVKKFVDEKMSQGNFILADPYTPYDLKYHRQFIEPDWDLTLEKLKAKDYRYIVLKRSYYQNYLPKDNSGSSGNIGKVSDVSNAGSDGNADSAGNAGPVGNVAHLQNMNKTQEFYSLFVYSKNNEVVDPSGKKWKKIYNDNCTYEIWEN